MSDRRPETDADILSRSQALNARQALRARRGRRGYSLDLPAHMAECDANYLRINKLFPNLASEDERRLDVQFGQARWQVHLSVVERSRYTTLVRLKQLDANGETGGDWDVAPRMLVRLYHDANSAEVVEYQQQNRFHGVYEYPNQRMRQRDEKAQINRFLSEYAELCLEHGLSPA